MNKIYIALPFLAVMLLAMPTALAEDIYTACPEGQQKYLEIGSLSSYSCVDPPTDTVEFPIGTLGEAVVYAQELTNVQCSGASHINIHPVFDYPLTSTKSVSLECIDSNSYIVWKVHYKTEDGMLLSLQCNNVDYPDCADNYEYPYPTPVVESIPEYFCNKDEYYDYLRSMVNFALNEDGSITYPDDYDLSSTLDLESIKTRAERACYYVDGTPTYPYLENTNNFYWSENCYKQVGIYTASCERGEFGCSCTNYARCSVAKDDGARATLWGFQVNNEGHIIPDTVRRDLGGGRASYRLGYGFTETGLCFRGCFLGTCEAPTPKPPNPNPIIHFSWIADAFQDFIANVKGVMCSRFGIWC